jgi:hypothetical protein
MYEMVALLSFKSNLLLSPYTECHTYHCHIDRFYSYYLNREVCFRFRFAETRMQYSRLYNLVIRIECAKCSYHQRMRVRKCHVASRKAIHKQVYYLAISLERECIPVEQALVDTIGCILARHVTESIERMHIE